MNKTKRSIYIPEGKYSILKGFASNRNISMNSLIIEALDKVYGLELFSQKKSTLSNKKEVQNKQ